MKFLFDLFPVIVFFATYKLAGGGEKGGGGEISFGLVRVAEHPIDEIR